MRHFVIITILLSFGSWGLPMAEAGLLGPSPYFSFADSPFAGGDFDYFHLEDFEDGALNTPGVSASAGFVVSPSHLTDSVDGDDGSIDGLGQDGHSYYQGGGTSITFTFSASVLGDLPTHAGVVWTDVGGFAGYSGTVTFRAYDASGVLLGTVGPAVVGDAIADGTTTEDRFLGIRGTTGIKRVVLAMDDRDWEMDHLQYGLPEPSMGLLVGMAGFWFTGRRKKKDMTWI